MLHGSEAAAAAAAASGCMAKSQGAPRHTALESVRLYLTFNQAEYSRVATADYSDAAGEEGKGGE